MVLEIRKNLVKSIRNFRSANILIIGDLMLDVFVRGRVRRISPEAPVPVVEVQGETVHLGGSANVVQNIRHLEGKVSVCGIVGKDMAGRDIMQELQKLDVDCSGIIEDSQRPTTIKTRVIAQHQQIVRFDKESSDYANRKHAERIADYVYSNYKKFDLLIISDYGKGVISRMLFKNLSGLLNRKEIPVIVDPKTKNYKFYSNVTILTPNTSETQEMAGFEFTSEDDFYKAGIKIIKAKNADALLITRSEHGMTLITKNGKKIDIPTMAKEVFDVTGAGDTVVAVLSLGLATGLNFVESAVIANHAAGIVVGKLGTAMASPDELILSLRSEGR
ncbi:MAG TPA: D-glycero-beta-D-manno-heptose-7-phosphate kinase [bacterium]